MPIAATDIVFYGSAVMPDDDTVLNIGGAIATNKRVVFTDISPTGSIAIHSTAAGDTTPTVHVYGRNAAGVAVDEVKTLSGTATIRYTTTQFERISKAMMTTDATGTVYVRKMVGGIFTSNTGTMVTFDRLPFKTNEVRKIFYNALASASGGSTTNYHEKIFSRNNHSSLTLTSAQIIEQSDPSTKCSFGLEASLDGTGTNGAGNNRTVAPGGITFDSATKNVANSQNHTAGSGQGIWMRATLNAGDAPQKTSVTMRETGVTA